MDAGKPQKQALAIAYATKRKMRKGGMVDSAQYAEGGVVDHDDVMEGDVDNFLSAEEDSESPFQDQAVESDEQELEEKYDDGSYSALSNLDNEQGDEDQAEARKGVMERIMRQVRMRNMGR